MSMRWSYIGELGADGALDWGGDFSGNIPASGHFLPDWEDLKLYLKIRQHAREGRYHGAQIDFDACAIKVNGPEMLAVLEECYGDPDAADPTSLLGKYVAFAKALGPENCIAFISCAI